MRNEVEIVVNAANLLSRDEARRIAANIGKLPSFGLSTTPHQRLGGWTIMHEVQERHWRAAVRSLILRVQTCYWAVPLRNARNILNARLASGYVSLAGRSLQISR
jgi:hypothetical protein